MAFPAMPGSVFHPFSATIPRLMLQKKFKLVSPFQPTGDQPKAIEKDASINEEIEKFRHAATFNLLTRRDTLIVASVSCIYGLGNVEDYEALAIKLERGMPIKRDQLLRRLTDIQYRRSGMDFKQG